MENQSGHKINETGEKRKKRKRKRKARSDKKDENTEKTDFEHKPNVFIAMQINDQSIKTKLKSVQDHAERLSPELKETFVNVSKSHMTLQVFNVDEAELEKVGEAMQRAVLAVNVNSVQLHLKGISTFRDRVVFAKVEESKILKCLWNELDEQLSNLPGVGNFKVAKDNGITGHVTIMKSSKVKSKKMRHAKIPKETYQDFVEMDFGTENCHELQLLSMIKPPGKDGYYYRHLEVPLLPDNQVNNSIGNRFFGFCRESFGSPRSLFAISLIAFAGYKLYAWKKKA